MKDIYAKVDGGTGETATDGLFARFAGAVGVIGSMSRGGYSGQSLLDSAEELRLGGVSSEVIIEGVEAEMRHAAAEHDVFTVTRADEKVS